MPNQEPTTLLRLCLFFGVLLLFMPVQSRADFADLISEPETEAAIDEALRTEAPLLNQALEDAVARVVGGLEDPELQVQVVDRYLAVADRLGEAINQDDPEAALRDSLIILQQAEVSLQTDAAMGSLGDARFELIDGITDARSRILGFARLHLTREQFSSLQSITVAEEATRRSADPGHRRFFAFGSRIESQEAHGYLSQIASAPGRAMNAVPGAEVAEGALKQTFGILGGAARLPGRAVGGVTEGVGAVAGIGGIEHLSVTLRQLPSDVQENTSKILADEGYKATLQSVDGLTTATGNVASAVERLPEEIRGTLDKFEESQPELRETIKTSDVAIRSVEAVLTQAERASQALESTIRAAGETAEIAARLMPPPKPEPEVPAEPFRMESVTEAAVALEATIDELRQTILTVHELINEPRIPELASTAADETKSLVNHIIGRVLILVAGILVLLLAYHAAKHYMMKALTKRPPTDGAAGASA
jgi:hypothetical protein